MRISLVFSILACGMVAGQDLARQGKGIITTVAGVDAVFDGNGKPADTVALGGPLTIASARDGSFFIGDDTHSMVFRVDSSRTLTIVAGTGIRADTGDDGGARFASLDGVLALVVDSAGNLTVATRTRIRQISASNRISTVAFHDFVSPRLAVNVAGDVFVAGRGGTSRLVRRINTKGGVTTVAGSAEAPSRFALDGSPATSPIGDVAGLAVDSAGRPVFIEENFYSGAFFSGVTSWIRKVDAGRFAESTPIGGGRISGLTVAADGTMYTTIDGAVHSIKRAVPVEITRLSPELKAANILVDPKLCSSSPYGLLHVDSREPQVKCADSRLAGSASATSSGSADRARAVSFLRPSGLAFDPTNGRLYVGDERAMLVHAILPGGGIFCYAGGGTLGDGAPGSSVKLESASPITVSPASELIIAGAAVRAPQSLATLVPPIRFLNSAGHLTSLFLGDSFTRVTALHASGKDLYFAANVGDGRGESASIWRRSDIGALEKIAGNGQRFDSPQIYSGAPKALNALLPLGQIKAMQADGAGNILFSDSAHTHLYDAKTATLSTRLRDVPANGFIWTGPQSFLYSSDRQVRFQSGAGSVPIAGGGSGPDRGDGGLAVNAVLREAGAIALDNENNLYIADPSDARIRKVLAAPPRFDPPTLNDEPVTTLNFKASVGGRPAAQQRILIRASSADGVAVPGVAFTARSSAPWLRVEDVESFSAQTARLIAIVADPNSLTARSYSASITLSMPNALPAERVIQVRFEVEPEQDPSLELSEGKIVFSIPKGGGLSRQSISAANVGGRLLRLNVAADPSPGCRWLNVNAEQKRFEISSRSPVDIPVEANAGPLPEGIYTCEIAFSSNGIELATIPVTLAVTARNKTLQLSQRGLSFTAVQAGGTVPSQEFTVLNLGSGALDFSVTTEIRTTAQWLKVDVRKDPENGGPQGVVTVSVDTAGLAAGEYSGIVVVDAPAAPNAPHFVTVYLRVLPPSATPPPLASPVRLSFPRGATAPSAQELLIYGLTSGPVGVHVSSSLQNVRVFPTDALIERGQPMRVLVQPIDADPVRGAVSIQFDDGRFIQVPIETAPPPVNPSITQSRLGSSGLAADCEGTLQASVMSLGPGFRVSANWPVRVRVELKDACGVPIRKGRSTVSVVLTNGDRQPALDEIRAGVWEGTWTAGQIAPDQSPDVVMTVTAKLTSGTQQVVALNGTLGNGGERPELLTAEMDKRNKVFAPGGPLTVTGYRLYFGDPISAGETYPDTFGSTTVRVGQRNAPLVSASQSTVDIMVPFAAPVDSAKVQLFLNRGSMYSMPVDIRIAKAQPEIESMEIKDGILVIRCMGLGRDREGLAKDGVPPETDLALAEEVSLTVGGNPVDQIDARMVAGKIGKYEIRAPLPPDAVAGALVTVTAARRSSEKPLPELGATAPSSLRPKR